MNLISLRKIKKSMWQFVQSDIRIQARSSIDKDVWYLIWAGIRDPIESLIYENIQFNIHEELNETKRN